MNFKPCQNDAFLKQKQFQTQKPTSNQHKRKEKQKMSLIKQCANLMSIPKHDVSCVSWLEKSRCINHIFKQHDVRGLVTMCKRKRRTFGLIPSGNQPPPTVVTAQPGCPLTLPSSRTRTKRQEGKSRHAHKTIKGLLTARDLAYSGQALERMDTSTVCSIMK